MRERLTSDISSGRSTARQRFHFALPGERRDLTAGERAGDLILLVHPGGRAGARALDLGFGQEGVGRERGQECADRCAPA
jgi:hypothetical protein